ncbi:MAG: vWA domain-containing protein [Polyangiaceae bacterium]
MNRIRLFASCLVLGLATSAIALASGCGEAAPSVSEFDQAATTDASTPFEPPAPDFPDSATETPLDPDALLAASCANAKNDANRAPVYMLFVLDGSGSMNQSGKWQAVVPALHAIFDELKKADDPSFAAGLTIFADLADPTITDTSAGPYDKMDVPVRFVDGSQLTALKSRLDNTSPYLGTPTYEVLDGQYKLLRAFTPAAPVLAGGKKFVVFITDGVPDPDMPAGENEGPGSLLLAQAAHALPAPEGPIDTFVIGTGPFPNPADGGVSYSPEFCGQLAVAGGTRASATCNPSETANASNACFFQVTPPASGSPSQAEVDALRQKFIDAINTIRTRALPCEYALKKTVDGGTGIVDPTKLNVIYTSGAGARTLVPGDATNGWTVDDPSDPTKVLLHGKACETAKADPAGKMLVVVGCKTVLK